MRRLGGGQNVLYKCPIKREIGAGSKARQEGAVLKRTSAVISSPRVGNLLFPRGPNDICSPWVRGLTLRGTSLCHPRSGFQRLPLDPLDPLDPLPEPDDVPAAPGPEELERPKSLPP